jgi:hypothetical protein
MVACLVLPVFACFAFYFALARRLDGDENVSPLAILLPYCCAQLTTLAILALGGGTTLNATPGAGAAAAAVPFPRLCAAPPDRARPSPPGPLGPSEGALGTAAVLGGVAPPFPQMGVRPVDANDAVRRTRTLHAKS